MTPHGSHFSDRHTCPRVISGAHTPSGILALTTLLELALKADFSFVLHLALHAGSSPDSRDHIFSHFVFPTQPDSSSVSFTLAAPTPFCLFSFFCREIRKKVNNSKFSKDLEQLRSLELNWRCLLTISLWLEVSVSH